MNQADITVSVVIPLYNGAAFIAQALDTVFAQSLVPTEVIVVDDGSSDAGPAIVAEYAARCPITLLQKANGGQSSARNFGIRHATGKLIALLDQDDRWYPHHLRDLCEPFVEDDTNLLGWTYSNLDEITENGRLRVRAVLSTTKAEHPKTSLEKCLADDMFILPSAAVILRSAFDAVGGFDEQLSGYEDDDLFIRLFCAGYENIYVDTALGQWRIFPSSASFTPRMIVSRMRFAHKLLAAFPDEPNLSRFYSRDLIAPRFLRQAVEAAQAALHRGDNDAAEIYLKDISFLEGHTLGPQDPLGHQRALLITAIIPLYNGASFIQEALESVLAQDLLPDEIIVVDDGSTDQGPEIVKRIAADSPARPIRLITKQNGGQSSARNLGVDHAHGDLIAFLDQDDIWYPHHLSTLITPFTEKRAIEVGWTYSDLDEVNEAGDIITRNFLGSLKTGHPKRDLISCLKEDMFVLPSAALITRKAFLAVGGFDERLSGYEDDDLFLRLFMAGFDNVFIGESLSKWRIYQLSASYSPRMAVSRAIYARMLIERFPDDVDMARYPVRDYIAPRFFRVTATEVRKAVLKGTRQQQLIAVGNLSFITGYLPLRRRIPLQLFLLPALKLPLIARFIMQHRALFLFLLRRVF